MFFFFLLVCFFIFFFFFFQAEDGIRDLYVTGVQTCALPIWRLGRPGVVRPEESAGEGRPGWPGRLRRPRAVCRPGRPAPARGIRWQGAILVGPRARRLA